MFKQLVIIIALSVGIVLATPYAQMGVQWLLNAHDWITQLLSDVFSGGQAGNIAKGIIALLSIPIIVGLIPTIVYWLLRRHWFPYFMQIVWIVWLIQAGALLMTFKAVV